MASDLSPGQLAVQDQNRAEAVAKLPDARQFIVVLDLGKEGEAPGEVLLIASADEAIMQMTHDEICQRLTDARVRRAAHRLLGTDPDADGD